MGGYRLVLCGRYTGAILGIIYGLYKGYTGVIQGLYRGF